MSRIASAGLGSPPSTTWMALGSNFTISVAASIFNWIDWDLKATFSKLPKVSPAPALWQLVQNFGMLALAAGASASAAGASPIAITAARVRSFMARTPFLTGWYDVGTDAHEPCEKELRERASLSPPLGARDGRDRLTYINAPLYTPGHWSEVPEKKAKKRGRKPAPQGALLKTEEEPAGLSPTRSRGGSGMTFRMDYLAIAVPSPCFLEKSVSYLNPCLGDGGTGQRMSSPTGDIQNALQT